MTYIIAEAGVNHNGSIELAKQLIDVAANSGADAVKFQTFKADKLALGHAPKAEYQKRNTNQQESQLEMLKKLELSYENHKILVDYCQLKKIQFLSTPFDFESADFLVKSLDLPIIKISSGEITTAPLLLQIAQSGKRVIMSTGMATLSDIEQALGVLAFGYLGLKNPSQHGFLRAFASEEGQKRLKEQVTLLHCTSAYPANLDDVHLRAMDTLGAAFDLPVGYSDHSMGITIPIAAVARGAVVIEKHFTLDRKLPGPDHQASLEPKELHQMVEAIRDVERALGGSLKIPTETEFDTRVVARKSLVAIKQIKKGELFSDENLGCMRPGGGISPLRYWDFLNQAASRHYPKGALLDE
jgi:N-acetylneuraminate synthase